MANSIEVLRLRARRAIHDKDQESLDAVALLMAFCMDSADGEALLREELALAPHDVQEFWGAPCNCNGHPN